MYNFNHYITRDKKISININFESIIKEINLSDFIKSYKISNFWKGKFFLKKLIKKVFKYQLLIPIQWNNHFWDNITVQLMKTKVDSEINYSTLESMIKSKTTPSRFRDIKKYQRLMNKGEEMPPLLYITGKCINYLGGTVKNEDVFILDGSRRLVANILNNNSPEILLINLENN